MNFVFLALHFRIYYYPHSDPEEWPSNSSPTSKPTSFSPSQVPSSFPYDIFKTKEQFQHAIGLFSKVASGKDSIYNEELHNIIDAFG